MLKWLGIDIGGANIKIANSTVFARSLSFPLWKNPDQLAHAVGGLLHQAPEFHCLAVTMTGELADCYETREEGVCRILEQVTSIVPAPLVRVYAVGGDWMTVSQAARSPWHAAASNWHALAQYCIPWTEGEPTVLVDVGSTTMDVIPIHAKIKTKAMTDSDRLIARQLVYAGVERTPVCSIVRTLPLRGADCPVMNELFATTDDAYLWLGHTAESPDDLATADGRPRTRLHAKFRLARMVGEDGSTVSDAEVEQMAEAIFAAHAQLLAQAIQAQCPFGKQGKPQRIISSGHGEFVIDRALEMMNWSPQRFSLMELMGAEASRSSPARAVAHLAEVQLSAEFSQMERMFEAGE